MSVRSVVRYIKASEEYFSEDGYLQCNPDVRQAIGAGMFSSGLEHFRQYGAAEGRNQINTGGIAELRQKKYTRIAKLIDRRLPFDEYDSKFNFLTPELRQQFSIVDTDNVSANPYDPLIVSLIEEFPNGMILDCWAGQRPVLYENVVLYEIVDYDTTDVVGVGEVLPFIDGAFDAVISSAVLEHVKDPFACAREIARVVRPGGKLFCCVPFLQPLHGYPHHYYNMSHQGLANLFSPYFTVESQLVVPTTLPVWTLSWFLNSWSQGLPEAARERFLSLTVRDLLRHPGEQLGEDYVADLSEDKNFELASATVLLGRKPWL